MRALALLGILATALISATPAAAVDFGVVVGSAQTGSSSTAVAASQGSSASALFGLTAQNSSAGAVSGGTGTSLLSGNDSQSSSLHESQTQQAGGSFSLGLAGSQNSNFALGTGQSAAQNSIVGIWGFIQP